MPLGGARMAIYPITSRHKSRTRNSQSGEDRRGAGVALRKRWRTLVLRRWSVQRGQSRFASCGIEPSERIREDPEGLFVDLVP